MIDALFESLVVGSALLLIAVPVVVAYAVLALWRWARRR